LVEPQGEVFDSEALWARLRSRDWPGRRVLVVRGEGGRDWLAEQLDAAGARVEFVTAYRRVLPQPDAAWLALRDAALARPQQHLWAISSSQAAANLQQLSPGVDWSASAAVAPHARIVDVLQRLGFGQLRLVPVSAAALAAVVRSAVALQGRPIQSGAS
jgi:uroporphyrinogen-III synthase